jgi:teichuronic acid biosynthesis protein TuaF
VLKQMGLSIIHRLKRFFILLLIIPLITAGVAFFMEMGKETTYTASVPFELGNFENEKLTGKSTVKDYFQEDTYLQDVKKASNLDYSIEEIKNGLKIEEGGDHIVVFKHTSPNKQESEEIVQAISDYFLEISEEKYDEKLSLLKEYEEKVEKTEAARGYLVEEELEFMKETEMTITNIRKTQPLQEITLDESYKNPLKRAVFGFLVGLMLSLFLLIVPELFKEYRD